MPPLFKFHCLLEACYFCETEKLLHSYRYVAKFLHIIKPELKFFDHRDVNFEIIIVDDGSPDGTQDIVKQLQQVYGEDRVVSIV
jgi:cellulose synthase/poly-beta-1,6-N-acetylglucosamine synthase-like glycosyltransferase